MGRVTSSFFMLCTCYLSRACFLGQGCVKSRKKRRPLVGPAIRKVRPLVGEQRVSSE